MGQIVRIEASNGHLDNVRLLDSNRGFDDSEIGKIIENIEKAVVLSKFSGSVDIIRGKSDPLADGEEGAAITSWTILNLFIRPNTILFEPSFYDDDMLGITLTHELIHCRQGFWLILWQNLEWAILRKSGLPPFEEEAYDAVNTWYDSKD